jgi:hypothetical protein
MGIEAIEISSMIVRASPPRGSVCYFGTYDNLFSDRTKKVSPTANFYYIFSVSNRIALDFGSIFLEIETNRIVSYCPATAQVKCA